MMIPNQQQPWPQPHHSVSLHQRQRHLSLVHRQLHRSLVVPRTPAYIEDVIPGSAAATAGIKTDDLVLFVNGELIQSCRHLNEVLGKLEEGSNVDLVFRREGKLQTIKLTAPKKSE